MSEQYITPNSRIKIEWVDLPENYTTENKTKIKNKISKKYGVDKSQIDISFISAKKNEKGDLIEITGANLDNILDTNYQHSLFKVWLEREGIDSDYDKLLEIDKEVSVDLVGDYEQTKFNKWSLQWLKINNFLAYGKDNKLNLNELSGLTVISSEPANQGGKTSLIVDAILFLFIGKTTKTDKNEEIFNRYSQDDILSVKGLVNLGGVNYTIERRLKRTAKRTGGYTITSSVKYLKYMPDGTEQDLTEEQSIETTKEIKKMVGNEDIFNLTILTTGDNLMDLINGKPTENGKLLNKLIGLGIIEEKEAIARDKYNTWKKTKISNRYSVVDLMDEITSAEETIELYDSLVETHNNTIEVLTKERESLESNKDTLQTSLKNIEVNNKQLDKATIEADIQEIKAKGKQTNARIKELKLNIEALKEFIYDEVVYSETMNEKHSTNAKKYTVNSEVDDLKHKIDHLTNSEFCHSCGQALPDVDNTSQIKTTTKELNTKIDEYNALVQKEKDLDVLLESMRENKEKYDLRNKLEVEKDRLEIETKSLLLDYRSREADLKVFIENEESISHNNEVKLKIDVVNTNIQINANSMRTVNDKLRDVLIELERKKDLIKDNKELIEEIKKEELKDKLYNTYIKMVGRNGISKIVIRSVVPLINAELERIMEDSLDIKLNLDINDKNEVELNIVDGDITRPAKGGSGYEKTIASLALRSVLTKISQLPTPNFIVFDEIFGKVSPDNYEKTRFFFDKIKHLFDTLFLIVHDERLSDWGDHNVLVKKTNKVSKIIG